MVLIPTIICLVSVRLFAGGLSLRGHTGAELQQEVGEGRENKENTSAAAKSDWEARPASVYK
ncbi:hypothetical protein NQZ68_040878 [Dissostichus eleginoides]|nr:hypothetical protein NQZ68_040878 [Dissostichus eleginoides]